MLDITKFERRHVFQFNKVCNNSLSTKRVRYGCLCVEEWVRINPEVLKTVTSPVISQLTIYKGIENPNSSAS